MLTVEANIEKKREMRNVLSRNDYSYNQLIFN